MNQPQPRTAGALPDYRFWTEEKLRNTDTDQQGHVNNGMMSSYFEAGRIEILDNPAIVSIRKVTRIVVVRMLVNFRQELFYPGTVRVGSSVTRIGRTSFEFSQAIHSAKGEVATAEATCVLLDRATRKPTPVPDQLRAFLSGSK